MFNTRTLRIALFALALAALASVSVLAAPKTYLAVVTGSTGGTYYPVGTIFATVWNKELGASLNLQASAQSSGGTAENLNMLKQGEAELAIAMTNLAWFSYSGTEMYQGKPNADLRMITGLWPDVTQYVVAVNSKINSIADLKGKRFCTGAVGSGTEYSSKAINRIIGGLVEKDYRAEHLGYFESSAAMQNGQLDGFNAEGGVPTSAVSEIFASATAVKLLEFSDADYQKLSAEVPFYVKYIIPANTYKGQTKNINTIGVKCALIGTSKISDEVAYSITKIMYEKLTELQASHKALEYMTLERAVEGLPPIPLHPGAVKFYQEKGIAIPINLLPKK
jgi:TRAP transporter TAXI family solute receptor